MLVYGTCNPEGYGDESYEGLYLTDADIRNIAPDMPGIPVKIEHRGMDVGNVVSAWVHEVQQLVVVSLLFSFVFQLFSAIFSYHAQGRMDVLMELSENHLEGAMGKEFVRRGLCPELSLGYNVTMSKSPAGFYKASNKKVVELSLVRQGARDGCKIRAFADGPKKQHRIIV
jgi:hypothetical protein